MLGPVINFSDALLGYPENPVLEGINLSVPQEAFLYLLGKTGSGKSTFLKTLYGQLPPLSGKAQVLGMNLQHLDRHSIPALRRRLGIVFQDFNLLEDRNAEANLDFVLRATDWKNKKKRRARIEEVLAQVGLEETAMEIMDLILRIKSQSKATLIIATHNSQLIKKYPAQKLICRDGALLVEQAAFIE